MFAKLNHVAIVSENYAQLCKFYEAMFGMTTSSKTRPARAVTVRDGYVGLNINPRRAGRSAGFDHFGIRWKTAKPRSTGCGKHYPDGEMAEAARPTAPSPASPRTIRTATCSISRRRT